MLWQERVKLKVKELMTRRSSLAILSGILLSLSFPNFSLGFLAWIALVPLLEAVRLARSQKQAVFSGLTAGVVHFGISLHWLVHVTTFGWIFVTFLQTSFLILFCWFVNIGRKIQRPYVKILWISLAWTTTEILRAEVPVFGLGWNLLAYSQSDYSLVRQIANTVGAYGLGFLIALINVCLAELLPIIRKLRTRKRWVVLLRRPVFSSKSREVFRYPVLMVFILSGLFCHGIYHAGYWGPIENSVRISLIQGNIPQDIKWDPAVRQDILEIYKKLSELSLFDRPDLILWPEAAFPGYLNVRLESEGIDLFVRKIGIPVLIGSPHLENDDEAYNSAYLLDHTGHIRKRYDKQYLVPFGEYVPLKPIFGWLEPLAYSLGVSDFRAGREATVFRLPNRDFSFSVMICFEDVFTNIAREFVSRGADFLTVITNDAWFDRSAAPYQHLQASIFRAVENGVPVLRAANTGISAFICEKGEVLARVQDGKANDIFVTGRKTISVPIRRDKTLFLMGGWLFPYLAALVFIAMFLFKERWERNAKKQEARGKK